MCLVYCTSFAFLVGLVDLIISVAASISTDLCTMRWNNPSLASARLCSDKVDHGVLLHKLKSMGITGDLGNWLLNFLSDRKHFVHMPGGISNDGPVLSGVPQGTVLGPLLFLVLLSDISKDINHSSVVSFADDTRVFRQIIDINDCSLLQNDLDNIYSWASVNNMVFNDSKFQHMSYHHQLQHRSCNHIYLSPSMNIINSNDHTRDLGITMSGDCSFNEHINLRTKQCRQLTGWSLDTAYIQIQR